MLNSISWQQYLTAVIFLAIAWYTYVGLRYYRPELQNLLKIKPQVKSATPAVASTLTEVMGEAKPESDTGLYESQELIFTTSQPDDISDQTLPKGPSDDLLAEANILIAAYGENDNKTEFLSLFKLLLDKYEVFADEISLPQVIKALKTSKFPFTIQASEWPLTFAS